MPSGEREAASLLWDQCLSDLGNDDMSDLILHLRDLAGRQRSSQPVEKDILTRYRLNKRGLDFIYRDLLPAARNLLTLKNADLGLEEERPEIRRAIRHMEWTGNTHWCVPALRWLERRGPEDTETSEFLRLLARKVWLLRVCAVDAVEYRRRCIALATEIADGRAVAEMVELQVHRQTRQRAYHNLTSRTFYDKRYCRALLRYLSDLLGEDPAAIDGDGVTVEHVLPKKPRKSSRWSKDFPTANSSRPTRIASATSSSSRMWTTRRSPTRTTNSSGMRCAAPASASRSMPPTNRPGRPKSSTGARRNSPASSSHTGAWQPRGGDREAGCLPGPSCPPAKSGGRPIGDPGSPAARRIRYHEPRNHHRRGTTKP